ncbi:hypothetical protein [Atopococcus tabaci]|uniref:hypothetical protein n=1 Tax=Atopococcus tabaci TaxID=269774 RepID=UPI0024094842|nr:hypothetical protein [Atopococcus tabaci]
MKKPFYKRWWFLALVALVLLGAVQDLFSSDEPEEVAVESQPIEEAESEESSIEVVESEPESETFTAEDWVNENKRENIEVVIENFEAIENQEVKNKVNEQVADSDETLFGNEVVATGTVTEFYEGNDGITSASFYMVTENEIVVRVSAQRAREDLEVGDKVEVTGLIASPIDEDVIYLREASVMIR